MLRLASFFKIVALLSLLAVLGVAGYCIQQAFMACRDGDRANHEAIQTLKSTVEALDHDMKALQEKSAGAHVEQARVEQLLAQLHSQMTRLKNDRAWVLSEVHDIVFAAKERLAMTREKDAAMAQLAVAEQRLTALNDPTLLPVKVALGKDMASLAQVEQVNQQSLWVELGALSGSIVALPLKVVAVEQHTTLAFPTWEAFKGLIKITRVEDNPLPVGWLPEEKAAFQYGLQLLIEQAQWSVLQGDSQIYQKTLEKLATLLQRHFADNEARTVVLNRIQQLKQAPVKSVIPDLSATLQALSQVMQARESL